MIIIQTSQHAYTYKYNENAMMNVFRQMWLYPKKQSRKRTKEKRELGGGRGDSRISFRIYTTSTNIVVHLLQRQRTYSRNTEIPIRLMIISVFVLKPMMEVSRNAITHTHTHIQATHTHIALSLRTYSAYESVRPVVVFLVF